MLQCSRMKRRAATICAISTPVGVSGIGIVRLSGPKALRVLAQLFAPDRGARAAVSSFASHTAHYGRILDSGRLVDEALVTVLRAPATYTREDMAEIGCHGSPLILKTVLRLCLERGCRLAEPGEFTKRAFLNGRLDLAQAEAVPGVLHSRTGKALAASLGQLSGAFSAEVASLRRQVSGLLARIELSRDLSDGTTAPRAEVEKGLRSLLADADALLKRAEGGRIVSEGLRAAIIGRPNVGKSSLLNALLGEERAIVTEIPGTTRDSIEECLDVRGVPLRLVDTAGICDASGPIEAAGARRSLDWLARADIVLLVLDGSRPLEKEDEDLLSRTKGRPSVIVANKCDLPRRLSPAALKRLAGGRAIVQASALKSVGLERLLDEVSRLAWRGAARAGDQALVLSSRQQGLLLSVSRHCGDALRTTRSGGSPDFVCLDLREASEELGRFLGSNLSEKDIDDVFSYFCVGK